jgi:hypothetical protein
MLEPTQKLDNCLDASDWLDTWTRPINKDSIDSQLTKQDRELVAGELRRTVPPPSTWSLNMARNRVSRRAAASHASSNSFTLWRRRTNSWGVGCPTHTHPRAAKFCVAGPEKTRRGHSLTRPRPRAGLCRFDDDARRPRRDREWQREALNSAWAQVDWSPKKRRKKEKKLEKIKLFSSAPL